MTEIVAHWRELLVLGLLVAGALFLLLAAVGVVRMPDLYTRMQAATKATTLGVGCMLLAVAVYFDDFGVTVRALHNGGHPTRIRRPIIVNLALPQSCPGG